MLTYVPFDELTGEHLRYIAEGIQPLPEAIRPSAQDIMGDLQTGHLTAFEFPGGLIVVKTYCKRLDVRAFSGPVFLRADLAADLKRLAADWECDTIETMVYDPRLASAIEKVGGHVESWTVTLAVKD